MQFFFSQILFLYGKNQSVLNRIKHGHYISIIPISTVFRITDGRGGGGGHTSYGKKILFLIDVALLRLNGLMTIWTVTSTSTRFQVQFFTSLPLFSAQYAQNNGRELWAIYPDDGINLRKM